MIDPKASRERDVYALGVTRKTYTARGYASEVETPVEHARRGGGVY